MMYGDSLRSDRIDPSKLSVEDQRIWEADCERVRWGGKPRWVIIPGDPPTLATVIAPAGGQDA